MNRVKTNNLEISGGSGLSRKKKRPSVFRMASTMRVDSIAIVLSCLAVATAFQGPALVRYRAGRLKFACDDAGALRVFFACVLAPSNFFWKAMRKRQPAF